MIWLVRLAVLVAALVATAYFIGRCGGDDFNPDQPATPMTQDEVKKLPEEASRLSLTTGRAPIVREGRAPADDEDREAGLDYAAAVLESEEIPLPDGLGPAPGSAALYPLVRTSRDGDIGMLAVLNSRGEWDRKESRCPEGRRWEAGAQDSTMFFNCERALPGLLPKIGKSALKCGLATAAGYGVGWVVNALDEPDEPPPGEPEPPDEDVIDPWLPAGIFGGGCVVLEITG